MYCHLLSRQFPNSSSLRKPLSPGICVLFLKCLPAHTPILFRHNRGLSGIMFHAMIFLLLRVSSLSCIGISRILLASCPAVCTPLPREAQRTSFGPPSHLSLHPTHAHRAPGDFPPRLAQAILGRRRIWGSPNGAHARTGQLLGSPLASPHQRWPLWSAGGSPDPSSRTSTIK